MRFPWTKRKTPRVGCEATAQGFRVYGLVTLEDAKRLVAARSGEDPDAFIVVSLLPNMLLGYEFKRKEIAVKGPEDQ